MLDRHEIVTLSLCCGVGYYITVSMIWPHLTFSSDFPWPFNPERFPCRFPAKRPEGTFSGFLVPRAGSRIPHKIR